MTTLALAGDTMLGRSVGEHLATHPARTLFGADLLELLATTDGMVLNLECCISDHGTPWPGRVFHFRAPPSAIDALNLLGVRAVTLANNHALDFGEQALLDTLEHLNRAGIAVAGAGRNLQAARAPVSITVGRQEIAVLSFTDHPAEYAATVDRAGVAYADLAESVPRWLTDSVHELSASSALVLLSPHWGPNMTEQPLPYIRGAATELITAGARLIAGHSAHVFHGIEGPVLFDLGDFVDDYAVDPLLRNDLSLLWLLNIDETGPNSVEAVPLRLTYCHTELADGEDARWIRARFHQACQAFGTEVNEQDGRLVVQLPHSA
jgi:poly-gamma-glutamate capsule biosynthesis protein CapA/YwtB (metallophosphatase superfamily)